MGVMGLWLFDPQVATCLYSLQWFRAERSSGLKMLAFGCLVMTGNEPLDQNKACCDAWRFGSYLATGPCIN